MQNSDSHKTKKTLTLHHTWFARLGSLGFDDDLWFCKGGLEGRLRHFLYGGRDARAPRLEFGEAAGLFEPGAAVGGAFFGE